MFRISLQLTLFSALMFLAGCKSGGPNGSTGSQSNPEAKAMAGGHDYLIQATLFTQQSGEYQALCWQAWNFARLSLDDRLTRMKDQLPPAVVVDIDETVLDNSPYAGWQVMADHGYDSESWSKWTGQAIADTVPGAWSFIRHCAKRNVHVFYISNRKDAELEATKANLRKFAFPYVDDEHVLLRTGPSSKEERRETVRKNYSIVMYAGDNLEDFSQDFESKSNEERRDMVDRMHREFGVQYIVLPNPGYGSWEGPILLNRRDWSVSQKDSLRKATLKTF